MEKQKLENVHFEYDTGISLKVWIWVCITTSFLMSFFMKANILTFNYTEGLNDLQNDCNKC